MKEDIKTSAFDLRIMISFDIFVPDEFLLPDFQAIKQN